MLMRLVLLCAAEADWSSCVSIGWGPGACIRLARAAVIASTAAADALLPAVPTGGDLLEALTKGVASTHGWHAVIPLVHELCTSCIVIAIAIAIAIACDPCHICPPVRLCHQMCRCANWQIAVQ